MIQIINRQVHNYKILDYFLSVIYYKFIRIINAPFTVLVAIL